MPFLRGSSLVTKSLAFFSITPNLSVTPLLKSAVFKAVAASVIFVETESIIFALSVVRKSVLVFIVS